MRLAACHGCRLFLVQSARVLQHEQDVCLELISEKYLSACLLTLDYQEAHLGNPSQAAHPSHHPVRLASQLLRVRLFVGWHPHHSAEALSGHLRPAVDRSN